MDELRAAILVEQLKKADAILRALRTARQFLMQELGKELLWKLSHDQDGDNGTVCAVLAPSVARRRYAQLALKAAGFEAHTLYGGTIWTAWPHIVPAPPHRAAFQATELRLNRLLCVNLRPDLTEAHLAMLCWILKHTLS
jgi:dTDP-4-amino-4,6-dideoxygalactose transaminase